MTSAEAPLVEARGLTRSYGAVRALRGVDLTLAAGEVLLVLGPNGAGKSTLLRTLAGLLRPQAGTVRVAGRELHRDDPDARRADHGTEERTQQSGGVGVGAHVGHAEADDAAEDAGHHHREEGQEERGAGREHRRRGVWCVAQCVVGSAGSFRRVGHGPMVLPCRSP